MKKIFTKETRKNWLFVSMLGILLLIIYNWNLSKLGSICIIGDEFGYWSSGAHFSGLDWSDVASYNSYYSFGYGFWLAIILKLCGNSILAYRAAIILNSCFVLGIYILFVIFSIKFIGVVNKYKAYFVSFIVSLFSGLYFSSQSTQCETILAFFYVLEVFLLACYLKDAQIKKLLLLSINTIYLYCIHQRALIIIIALLLVLLLHAVFDHTKFKNLIVFIVLGACGLLIGIILKSDILECVYLNGVAVSSNNYSGQVSKIQMLFSLSGIKLFLKGILGKLYYMGASSFGLVYFGILFLFIEVKNGILKLKNRVEADHRFLFALFNLLVVAGIAAIATIQLLDNKRTDTLIYGRYSEFIMLPLILLGVYYIYEKFTAGSVLLICTVQLGLALIVINQLYVGGYLRVYTNNISGIAHFYHNTLNNTGFIYSCTAATIGIMMFYLVLMFIGRYKTIFKYISLAFIGCMWFWLGYTAADNQLFSFKDERSDLALFSFFEDLPEDMDVIYIPYDDTRDEFAYTNADYLQFIAYDKKIAMAEASKQIPDVNEYDYVVTQSSIPEDSKWYRKYTLLGKTPHFSLLALKDSAANAYYIDKYGKIEGSGYK